MVGDAHDAMLGETLQYQQCYLYPQRNTNGTRSPHSEGKGGLRVAILQVAWESVIVSRSYRVLGLIDFAPTNIIFSDVTLELLPSRRVFLPNKNKTSSNLYVSNLHRIKDRP